jgi:DNA polymerase-3 subunit delta'
MERVEFLTIEPGDAPEPDRLPGVPLPREMLSLLGQEEAESNFLAAFHAGKLHHAFLLTGPEGIGKATFAFRAARFLLDQPVEPANSGFFAMEPASTLDVPTQSRTTALVANEAHPDLAVLRRRYDAKAKRFRSEISVEDTREALALFNKTAAFGGWRAVIVDCADDLNIASANALLKTLEEPPKKAVFFLIAHQPGRLLPTIRSRCQVQPLAPLDSRTISTLLTAFNRPVPDPSLLELAAEGSIRRAIRLSEPKSAQMIAALHAILAGMPRPPREARARLLEALRAGIEGEQAMADLMDQLELHLARLLRRSIDGGAALAKTSEIAEFWAAQTEKARQVEALNLDRRAFASLLFDELATLVSHGKA